MQKTIFSQTKSYTKINKSTNQQNKRIDMVVSDQIKEFAADELIKIKIFPNGIIYLQRLSSTIILSTNSFAKIISMILSENPDLIVTAMSNNSDNAIIAFSEKKSH